MPTRNHSKKRRVRESDYTPEPISAVQPISRLANWVARSVRGLGVGAVASVVDLAVLTLLVQLLRLHPTEANVPALLAGAGVQFLGCRHLVFGAASESIKHQAVRFAVVELMTLVLNAALFHLCAGLLPYPILRIGITLLVYFGFSYPAWHWAFAPPARPPST